MRFLLAGDIDDVTAGELGELGHRAARPADLGLPPDAAPLDLREAARRHQYELVVADRAALEMVLPTSGRREVFGRVLVHLAVAPPDRPLAAARLFERYKRLTPGRLYTVTAARVKVAQLPASDS